MVEYRLDIGQISMQTQGGGIVHPEDAAYQTERVLYSAEVVNNTDQFLGPLEIDLTVDNTAIAYGGMSHQGIQAGQAVWVHGYTDHLTPGQHTLDITARSGAPDAFDGAQQSMAITVLEKHGAHPMHEGEEANHPGWSQKQVYITVHDYAGELITGDAYANFTGHGGEAGERGQCVDGALLFDSIWVPDDGMVTLTVTTQQTIHHTIHGTTDFKVDGPSAHLGFKQLRHKIHESWSSSEEFNNKVGAKGTAGVDFKVFSAGGEVSAEHGWSETHEHSSDYEVWIPTGELEDLSKPSAGDR